MRFGVLMLALLGCAEQVRAVQVDVVVPPEVQDLYSTDRRGEILVEDEELGAITTVGVLCEPTEADLTFEWNVQGPGCAQPSTVRAWIRAIDFEIPCGELFSSAGGEPEDGQPYVEGEVFAEGDPRKCLSGADSIELRF